jgi:hypothetical protein
MRLCCATFILTCLFGAIAIKNSFTVFDLSILLIAGRTKLNIFVIAAGRGLHRPDLDPAYYYTAPGLAWVQC